MAITKSSVEDPGRTACGSTSQVLPNAASNLIYSGSLTRL